MNAIYPLHQNKKLYKNKGIKCFEFFVLLLNKFIKKYIFF